MPSFSGGFQSRRHRHSTTVRTRTRVVDAQPARAKKHPLTATRMRTSRLAWLFGRVHACVYQRFGVGNVISVEPLEGDARLSSLHDRWREDATHKFCEATTGLSVIPASAEVVP